MTDLAIPAAAALQATVDAISAEFAHANRVLKETRTLSATNTFQAIVRVPGKELLVVLSAADPFSHEQQVKAGVLAFDGSVVQGPPRAAAGGGRYIEVFKQRPEVGAVIHVHTPYLGAWAGTHRELPIRYAPAQRFTQIRSVPNYIDRRPTEASFILDRLAEDASHFAILEANGGSTFWGASVTEVSQNILLFEEAAYFTALSETIGGSQEFGPGVLEQQWALGKAFKAG
jgi:ribulose-5-phosphate 4-epimerase/fuculose-1-phosphate aldolase